MSELSLYTLNKQIEEIMENVDSSNINQISTDNIEINYDKGVYYVQYTGEDYSLGDKTLRSGNKFIMIVYNSVSGLTNNETTYRHNYSINTNDRDKFNNFYYREIILNENIYSGYLSYSFDSVLDSSYMDVHGGFYWTRKINNKDIDLKNINAKTLDGKYASDFAESGHTHTKNEITDFPTSLPANGGNADTLDWKDSTAFIEKGSNITISEYDEDISETISTEITSSHIKLYYNNGIDNDSTQINITNDSIKATKDITITPQKLIISGFDEISADKFIEDGQELKNKYLKLSGGEIRGNLTVNGTINGNGSGLTNVNADTVDGKHTSDFAESVHTHTKSEIADFPTSLPANGGNANTVNKITKTFTVQTGSWYRLATNNLDACGGVFVLTVGSGGAASTNVFSAAQQYSGVNNPEKKLSVLSHAGFNNCVTQLRLVNKYGSENEQYIDFYVENGTNGATGDLEVQFFGKGWTIKSSIATSNIVDGYIVTVIEL